MPCEHCSEPDENGNYTPCCLQEPCEHRKGDEIISYCIHCGGEMFEENDRWFHHTQREIPLKFRTPQW